MKHQIQELITNKPKHYVAMISRNTELLTWVNKNTLTSNDADLVDKIYSAVNQISNICSKGSIMKYNRNSKKFAGCGPANVCECTKIAISTGVSATKSEYSESKHLEINATRVATMIQKHGVAYNSQREDIKYIWTRPKIPAEVYCKLTNLDWMTEEYINKKKSLTEIADHLNIYYSTVAEYCHKFGFKIRKVSNSSKQERQLADYIESLGFSIIRNDWDTLITKEIDILVSEMNIGFEMNGLRYHSWNPLDSKKYEYRERHIDKTTQSNEKGISLIHITDQEWIHKQDIVKSMVRSKLKLNTRIAARKCTVKLVSTNEERSFLNSYHIQGYVTSVNCVGLYHEDKLVMIMSSGRSRFSKEAKNEILRVCAIPDITVVGGLSRLVKHTKLLINNETLITYCDLNNSTGNGYTTAGFTLLRQTAPGYFWTDSNAVYSRYKCQKANLAKWLTSFDKNKTESENMFDSKFRRFWDCGNLVFII